MAHGVSSERHDRGDNLVLSVGYAAAACICVAVGIVLAIRMAGESASPVVTEIEDKVNPNSASSASLARLPGIGPSRARAIISHRDRLSEQGGKEPPFRSPEDLLEITGIGPATLEGVRSWLDFGPRPTDEPGIAGGQPSEPLPN